MGREEEKLWMATLTRRWIYDGTRLHRLIIPLSTTHTWIVYFFLSLPVTDLYSRLTWVSANSSIAFITTCSLAPQEIKGKKDKYSIFEFFLSSGTGQNISTVKLCSSNSPLLNFIFLLRFWLLVFLFALKFLNSFAIPRELYLNNSFSHTAL